MVCRLSAPRASAVTGTRLVYHRLRRDAHMFYFICFPVPKLGQLTWPYSQMFAFQQLDVRTLAVPPPPLLRETSGSLLMKPYLGSERLALRYCGIAYLILKDVLWLWLADWKVAVIFGTDSSVNVVVTHSTPELLVKLHFLPFPCCQTYAEEGSCTLWNIG